MGILVHRRVTGPNIKFIHMAGEEHCEGNMRSGGVFFEREKEKNQGGSENARPGLEPGALYPGTSALPTYMGSH